jgi:hypothetical protein
MLKDLPWLLLRRLMGPLTLHDDCTRPEWCRSQAETKPTGFFDGLYNWMASPSIPSWNQIERFLQDMAQLRATGWSGRSARLPLPTRRFFDRVHASR